MNPVRGIETLPIPAQVWREMSPFKLMNPVRGIETSSLMSQPNFPSGFQINESRSRD